MAQSLWKAPKAYFHQDAQAIPLDCGILFFPHSPHLMRGPFICCIEVGWPWKNIEASKFMWNFRCTGCTWPDHVCHGRPRACVSYYKHTRAKVHASKNCHRCLICHWSKDWLKMKNLERWQSLPWRGWVKIWKRGMIMLYNSPLSLQELLAELIIIKRGKSGSSQGSAFVKWR